MTDPHTPGRHLQPLLELLERLLCLRPNLGRQRDYALVGRTTP